MTREPDLMPYESRVAVKSASDRPATAKLPVDFHTLLRPLYSITKIPTSGKITNVLGMLWLALSLCYL